MKYITGNYALNLECSLDTSGDWHQSCLDWGNIPLKESEGSIFGDYGIEENYNIPFHRGKKFFVANHLRAILDKIESNKYMTLTGFYNDFICTDKYNQEFFEKVFLLKDSKNWNKISEFIGKEFKNSWLSFLESKGIEKNRNKNMFKDLSWYKQHKKCMDDFCNFLFKRSNDHILKGGSALLYCYGLSRVSEDLDFNCYKDDLLDFVIEFCNKHGYLYNVKKDSEYKKKILINYGGSKKHLKVECNLLGRDEYTERILRVNSILTYDLNLMLEFKLWAYRDRYKPRDIYDIAFIVLTYYNSLPQNLITNVKTTLRDKGGLDNVEYILNNSEEDDLLNREEVLDISLKLFDFLGI